MMPAKPNPLLDLGKRMRDELAHDVPILAGRIQPEVEQAGAQKLSRQEFVALCHRNWASLDFRQAILKSMGPQNFMELAKEMVGTLGHPMVPGMQGPEGVGPLLATAPTRSLMPIPPGMTPSVAQTPSGEAPSTPMTPSAKVPGG